jgi:hypothetical protein
VTKAKAKPRIRKAKASAAISAAPAEPVAPPAPVCHECQRLLEIEKKVHDRLGETVAAINNALRYLDGHNYTVILSYLNNATTCLTPAVNDIRALYQEQETKRRGRM